MDNYSSRGYNAPEISPETMRRFKRAGLLFILVVVSGLVFAITTSLYSPVPINYHLKFSPTEQSGVGGYNITGSVTNTRNRSHPYIDITFEFGGQTATFRVDDVPAHSTVTVNTFVATGSTAPPVGTKIVRLDSPTVPPLWYAKLISGAIFGASLFLLLVPNITRGIRTIVRMHRQAVAEEKARRERFERAFCDDRREMFSLVDKTGEREYDFANSIIEPPQREVPLEARSVVAGSYQLAQYSPIKAESFSLEVSRDDAQQLARQFDLLEKGQEISVKHMPLKGLYGNAVVQTASRVGEGALVGFLRARDTRKLHWRYGDHFMFFGEVTKINDQDTRELSQTEFEPTVTLTIKVPALTSTNRYYDIPEFDAYDPSELFDESEYFPPDPDFNPNN